MRETNISRQHLTPELALFLITPQCRLFHEPQSPNQSRAFQEDPFWGFYWPGGQALSRFILDNPQVVEGKAVLDFGSGCGATSLAAVLSKAKYAVANDIDKAAGYATEMNAVLNIESKRRRSIEICADTLIGSLVSEGVVLVGDLFYDEEFADVLLPWLERLNKSGKQILVGDPGRHALTSKRMAHMEKLATYELTENGCIENNGFKLVNVWRFNPGRASKKS